MDDHSGGSRRPGPGHGDLGSGVDAGQPVEERRRPMRCNRTGPGGQRGRHDSLVPRHPATRDPVDAGVDAHQKTPGQTVVDHVARHAGRQQLGAPDDPVLGGGDVGHELVGIHVAQPTRGV